MSLPSPMRPRPLLTAALEAGQGASVVDLVKQLTRAQCRTMAPLALKHDCAPVLGKITERLARRSLRHEEHLWNDLFRQATSQRQIGCVEALLQHAPNGADTPGILSTCVARTVRDNHPEISRLTMKRLAWEDFVREMVIREGWPVADGLSLIMPIPLRWQEHIIRHAPAEKIPNLLAQQKSRQDRASLTEAALAPVQPPARPIRRV
jgi:hypothetical protein